MLNLLEGARDFFGYKDYSSDNNLNITTYPELGETENYTDSEYDYTNNEIRNKSNIILNLTTTESSIKTTSFNNVTTLSKMLTTRISNIRTSVTSPTPPKLPPSTSMPLEIKLSSPSLTTEKVIYMPARAYSIYQKVLAELKRNSLKPANDTVKQVHNYQETLYNNTLQFQEGLDNAKII
uniref:Uncharacterized protein n=1 Tax=Parastrongyloides trichosuri TaxID=131310 RepID=A0A0N4ZAY8_PARTI